MMVGGSPEFERLRPKLEKGFEDYWAQVMAANSWPPGTPREVRNATKELARSAWIAGRVEFFE